MLSKITVSRVDPLLVKNCIQVCLVIRDEAGLEADEDECPAPLLVPGHVEPVQVGVGTQPPQLEVHLPGVLARTHDRDNLLCRTAST